jgi:ubiquinone/menaquinone biosynthesis C-methylase UbiE
MADSNPDVISTQNLATGHHYYSEGKYLRQKHQLAGDKFVKWALGLIPSWTDVTVLDAGGGWGRFVWSLLDTYHIAGENVVLTDLSAGMLHTAQDEASQRAIAINRAICNIDALPFPNQHFEVVMANHVLYHLQDISQGVKELARVTKPHGHLLTTTNSDKITATIIAFHYQALEILGVPFDPEPPSSFSMENGGALFAAYFHRVEQHYYEDETLFYDAAEFRAMYESIGRYHDLLTRDDISEQIKSDLPRIVEQLAQDVIDREGVLRSPNLMGAFVCSDPI